MNTTTAIILYIGTVISFIQNWILVAVAMVVIFSFRYGAAAVIPMAIVLDGYFGNFYTTPYLSLTSVAWYLFVGFIKPKLINIKI